MSGGLRVEASPAIATNNAAAQKGPAIVCMIAMAVELPLMRGN